MGSTGDPPTLTSKWRCGPVQYPVQPTEATGWLLETVCPELTAKPERWLYVVAIPPP